MGAGGGSKVARENLSEQIVFDGEPWDEKPDMGSCRESVSGGGDSKIKDSKAEMDVFKDETDC